MICRFYLDPETGEPHIWKHSVSEQEVEQLLAEPSEVRTGRGGSMVAFGKTLAGRFLKVVYVPDDPPWGAFVVTAFDMGPEVRKAFRRRMERKNKKI